MQNNPTTGRGRFLVVGVQDCKHGSKEGCCEGTARLVVFRLQLAAPIQMSTAFSYKISFTNMESLHKLRGMVVFPAEETTRGYSC